jgi:hypothetical protein
MATQNKRMFIKKEFCAASAIAHSAATCKLALTPSIIHRLDLSYTILVSMGMHKISQVMILVVIDVMKNECGNVYCLFLDIQLITSFHLNV